MVNKRVKKVHATLNAHKGIISWAYCAISFAQTLIPELTMTVEHQLYLGCAVSGIMVFMHTEMEADE